MELIAKDSGYFTREVASPSNSGWSALPRNPNRTLLAEAGGRWGEYADLLRESQIHACLQVRKLALVGRPWRIEPESGDADKQAWERARWLEQLFHRFDWNGLLDSLMEAVVLGWRVAELIWISEAGRWIPQEIRIRPNERFAFDEQGALLLAGDVGGGFKPAHEPGKFLVATWGPRDGNRYGRGLGEMLYYLAWFKRENLKFWLTFNDKHAYPTPVAVMPEGAAEEEMRRMRDQLAKLKDQSVLVHRQGTEIRYLEAEKGGSVETFHRLIEFCNEEIAKVVLGQTLTTASPYQGGAGSYALGKVHNQVREDILAGDATWAQALAGRLLAWIVAFNFGPEGGRFRWSCAQQESPTQPKNEEGDSDR